MKTKPWAVPWLSEWRWTRTARGDALAAAVGFVPAASAFYLPNVPLTIALVGLIAASLAQTRRRFAIVLGWHIAAAWPAMLGLWNLGGGTTPLILLALWLCITTLIFTVLGPGIGTLLSLAVPWHIGSATLAAGELWPGTQELGLLLIPVMLCGLSAQKRTWQISTLIGAIAVSAGAWWACKPITANDFLEVNLDIPPAITTISREKALIAQLPEHSSVWLGENILSLNDKTALSRWCRYAAELQSEWFVGALELNDRATIRRFAPEECRASVVYERRFGLPGFPGGKGIGAGQLEDVMIGNLSIHWLICFEAFLPAAWIRMQPPVGSFVVIASNDRWTQPAPVYIARRKVAQAMARLWNVEAALAETGRTAVIGGPLGTTGGRNSGNADRNL